MPMKIDCVKNGCKIERDGCMKCPKGSCSLVIEREWNKVRVRQHQHQSGGEGWQSQNLEVETRQPAPADLGAWPLDDARIAALMVAEKLEELGRKAHADALRGLVNGTLADPLRAAALADRRWRSAAAIAVCMCGLGAAAGVIMSAAQALSGCW